MQLLGGGSAWVNDDWHLYGTKNLSIFCGIWDGEHTGPGFVISVRKDAPCNHQAIELQLQLWLWSLEVRVYDGRHWNDYSKRWIETEADEAEYRRQYDEDQ